MQSGRLLGDTAAMLAFVGGLVTLVAGVHSMFMRGYWAATVFFFFAEAGTVTNHWRTSFHVEGWVTLVAGVHYMYMREYWVQVHKSPVDWCITVPLQMIEFTVTGSSTQ